MDEGESIRALSHPNRVGRSSSPFPSVESLSIGHISQIDHPVTAIISVHCASVAQVLIGILVEQGKLDTDDLVSLYVLEVKGSAYESITIRQLLDMRSGISHDDALPEYRRATG